jgi:hypothetical protein
VEAACSNFLSRGFPLYSVRLSRLLLKLEEKESFSCFMAQHRLAHHLLMSNQFKETQEHLEQLAGSKWAWEESTVQALHDLAFTFGSRGEIDKSNINGMVRSSSAYHSRVRVSRFARCFPWGLVRIPEL